MREVTKNEREEERKCGNSGDGEKNMPECKREKEAALSFSIFRLYNFLDII